MGNFCDVMDDRNMPDDYHAKTKRGHRRNESRGSGFYLIEMQKPQNHIQQFNETSDSDFSSTYSM